MFSGSVPGYISWTGRSEINNGLCSGVGQATAGAVSVVVGVMSGGTAQVIGGFAASALIGDKVLDTLAGLIAGSGLDVANIAGAQFANVASYGARGGGSVIAMMSGANKLTETEEVALANHRKQKDSFELQEKGIAYKLFNYKDHRTLAAKTIESFPSNNAVMANMSSNISRFFGNIFTAPFDFFTNISFASKPRWL